MSDIAQAYRQAIVNYLRGGGAPPAIAGLYVDVFNGDPQAGGTSVLAAITGSAVRPAAGFGTASSATPSTSSNTAQLQLTAAALSASTITHIGLFDSTTNGNLVASHALTSGNQVTQVGNPVVVPVSALTLAL